MTTSRKNDYADDAGGKTVTIDESRIVSAAKCDALAAVGLEVATLVQA